MVPIRRMPLFGIFVANSDGDDLLLGEVRIPMLRQQRPSRKGLTLSVSG